MLRSPHSQFFFLSAFLCASVMNFAVSDLAAASNESNYEHYDSRQCSPDGVALGGFDVVAYHTQNAAVKGDASISSEHEGLNYHFSSVKNRDLFLDNQAKYLPHFSGWCAIALSNKRLTCPDYANFKIEDGKLLLFETIAFVNGRSVWDSDPLGNLLKAEQNFSELVLTPDNKQE